MKFRFLMPVVALAMASFALTGCGENGGENGGEEPEPPGPVDPPTLTITATAGYDIGEGQYFLPEGMGTFNIKSDKAKSFRSILVDAEAFDGLGETIESVLNQTEPDVYSDKRYMVMVNGKDGYNMIYNGITPGTRLYLLVELTGTTGGKVTDKAELKTAAVSGTASEDYKAWLGTWKVVSTNDQVDGGPVTFEDVVITEYVANKYYRVSGWGISGLRTEAAAAMVAMFDPATGNMDILNDQYIAPWSDEEIFDGRLCASGEFNYTTEEKYYILSGFGSGIIGTMGADKQKATAAGREFNLQNGDGPFSIASLDLFIFPGDPNDNRVWSLNPADGFTESPIGPYTMTKVAGPAPASAMTASNSIVAKSFTMSMMGKAGISDKHVVSIR